MHIIPENVLALVDEFAVVYEKAITAPTPDVGAIYARQMVTLVQQINAHVVFVDDPVQAVRASAILGIASKFTELSARYTAVLQRQTVKSS